MNKKLAIMTRLIIGLALLTISCQTFSNFEILSSPDPTPTPRTWPHSTFVPPQKSVQILVGEKFQIDSYHVSTEELKTIEIFVNGQLLRTEETSAGQTDTFPPDLAEVRVLLDDESVRVSSVEPEIPTAGKTVSLVWEGRVPGVYELSMKATDVTGRSGNTIIQRIEVK